jgi:hypothetical protein
LPFSWPSFVPLFSLYQFAFASLFLASFSYLSSFSCFAAFFFQPSLLALARPQLQG